jgi:hypothetical protein
MMTLMMDAARVIEIRLRMMALGQSIPNEMLLGSGKNQRVGGGPRDNCTWW